ncbi:hypothetical protein CHH28_07895 [Bacterioplanes sanyensis]|uniref:Uncharacterized protein n=1 Tax=Bacterioplanes sanyensis TaxID=1249553 RepID=A0A222FIX5_9GAMM|nr:hypothetical protein CHH28_07895 [Bacterioplanes sanyensis]
MSSTVELQGTVESAGAVSMNLGALDLHSNANIRSASGNSSIQVAGNANIEGQVLLSGASQVSASNLSNTGHIQASQLGVSVANTLNNSGKLVTDSIGVNAATITNSGQLHANQQTTLSAVNINNTGTLTSAQQMSLNAAGGTLSNSGTVNAVQLNASANRINTGAGSLINAQSANLTASQIENRGTLNQAQGAGQFTLSAQSIANLGASALMDITRGVVQTADLRNEGTLVSEGGSDSGQLNIQGLETLENSGQLFVHTDLSVAEQLSNSGKIQVNNLSAQSLSSFENSGDVRAKEVLQLGSQSTLNNEGNLLAKELELISQSQVMNSGLMRADTKLVIDGQRIQNMDGGEISTTNDQATLELTANQTAINRGNIIAKGDIDMNVAHFDNRGNMTATQTGTLKLDSLDNSGYIYGKDIVVGSQTQYITEDGLANSQGASGSSVTGLVARNSLTMFVRGLLQASYHSKLINLNSDQDLQVAGSIMADDALNIDAKGLTVMDTGTISINGGQPESVWKLDGDLMNQGSITSTADLNITAKQFSNEANVATNGLLSVKVDNLINSDAGVLSGVAGVSISGESDWAQSLLNEGSIISGSTLDIESKIISNRSKISAKGGYWNFDELNNAEEATIVNIGSHVIGSSASRAGSIRNSGVIFSIDASYFIEDLINSNTVYSLNGLVVDSAGTGHEDGGIVNKGDSWIGTSGGLSLVTTTSLTNLGTIKAGAVDSVIGASVINNGDGSSHVGTISSDGNLTLDASQFNNYGYRDSSAVKAYFDKVISYSYASWTKGDPSDYYWQHKVGFAYGEFEKTNHRSAVFSGGDLIFEGSVLNKSSDISSQADLTVAGSVNNVSDVFSVNYSQAEFLRDTNNNKVKTKNYFQYLSKYRHNAQPEDQDYDVFLHVTDNIYRNPSSGTNDSPSNYFFRGPWAIDESNSWGAISVTNMGSATLENPFTVAVISAKNGNFNWGGSLSNNGYIASRNFSSARNDHVPGMGGVGSGADQKLGEDAETVEEESIDYGDAPEQAEAQDVDTNAGHSGSDAASGTTDNEVADIDQIGVDMPADSPDFSNGVSGPNIIDLGRVPESALVLLNVPGSGFSYEDLNALSLGGDKDPDELSSDEALRAMLASLGQRQGNNQGVINDGQKNPFELSTPTLYDLPDEVRDMVLSALNYDPNPYSALENLSDAQRPEVSAEPLYNPIEEAELIRQAAMRQSGAAYFSNEWTSAKQQRDAMFNNTMDYLAANNDLTLGDALTAEQIAKLEAPLLWYTRINIGGQEKLVPTAYLPEATLAQMTVPTAGTIDADTMVLSGIDEFANTGAINVSGHASIDANTFRNERLVQSLHGVDSEYTIVDEGAAINAGSLAITTTEDINNIGGSIKTDGNLILDAGGGINLTAIETREYNKSGKNIDERNGYVTSTIEVGGNAELLAEGDINSQAASVSVEGDLDLDADNINLLGVTEREYTQRHTEKSGRFSSSKTTEQWETQTFKGTTFDVGGNTRMTAENDINMVGTTIEGDGNIGLKAGNDVLITAGISQESYSKEKSGKGVVTTSGQQKGHITQTAVGSNLHAGGNLTIDSDGGDVSILGSTLRAEENLLLGDMKIQRDETGAPILDENGQYITEDGESIANLTIGSVELKDEEWNEKQSGLKGPLKKLAQVAAFTLSATGAAQQMQALGIDTEITIARSESERTETTHHAGSKTTAGGNLVARLDDHLQVNGSEIGADGSGLLHSKSATYDTTVDTKTTTEQRSEESVSADRMALTKDEATIASATHTDHTETKTTVEQTANVTKLNFGGGLSSNTVEDTEFNGVLADIGGDASITGGNVRFGSASTTNSTVSEEETVETSYSVGVRNAYVDTAYAAEAVADATSAVGDAKDALDDAKRRVKDGTLAQSALDDYRANLAAAQAQLANATIALGAAGATAAGSTATGGFYASAGVNRSETSKQSSESHTTQHGSEFKIGGNAIITARDGGAIDLIGSSLDVGEHLSLDADDVNILASANESRSDSSEQSRSAGFSVSTSGAEGASAAQQMAAASGSANVNMQNSDSDSSSKTYNNSSIKAGSFSSTSKNLHLAGANVEITGDIDIITDNLVVESLQNESRSSHSSEGGGFSASSGGGGTVSYNNTDGSSERAWTDNQTTLIGGGNVNINAKNTEVHGAVVANAVRNEDGSLTDLGNLNLITDELTVTDLQDTDVSESSGVNLSVSVSSGKDEKGEHQLSSNSTTVGLTNQGHRKEQTTAGTLGGGTITRRDGSEHELGDTNRDLDQRQVVTLDQQTGGLNATVTVDHRLLSEEGRNEIKKTFVDTSQHVQEIAQAADDLTSTDIDTLAALNKVDEYATNRKVIAEKAADEAEQNKLRGDEGAEGSQEGLQELSNALTDAHGLEQGAEVALYDGSQVNDDTVAIDKTAVNKSEVAGAYHERDQGIYVNVDKTDMTDSTATVTTLVHEQTRHQMAENGDTGRLSRDDQTTLAHAAGERAGDAWEAYSDLAGVSTKGGSTAAQWRETQRHSAAVQQGTQNMAAINNNELKARQLNANEASMMDQARAAIDNSGLSDAEKAAQKSRLDDLACAEVQCAAGVNSNDPRYGELVAKQERGEAIKQNDNTDIIDMMGDLGVETVAQEETTIKNSFLGTDRVVTSEEQQFEYGLADKADDALGAQEHITAKVDGLVQVAGGVAGTASGAAMTVGGIATCAPSAGVGCGIATAGVGVIALSGNEVTEGVNKLRADHQFGNGQRVLDSFSSETHQGEHSPIEDLAVSAGTSAALVLTSKVGGRYVDDVVDAVSDKAPDISTAQRAGGVDADEMIAQDGPTYSGVKHEQNSSDSVNQSMTADGKEPAWTDNTVVTKETLLPNDSNQLEMIVTEGQLDAISAGKPAIGGWASKDKLPDTVQDARDVTAVKKEWKNDSTEDLHVITMQPKAPITGNSGSAREMYDEELDRTLPGGVTQFEFEDRQEAFQNLEIIDSRPLRPSSDSSSARNLNEQNVNASNHSDSSSVIESQARSQDVEKVVTKETKPDFIVSPNGTTMPTNKDFNLVDSNKQGGDWFQIHNKHTDAKVDGSPHTHYPKQHANSRTREIKSTDGADIDRADQALRDGLMRERLDRKDKGGQL